MFTDKYKEDTIEELYKSLNQLDRIEFQNKFIQQNQAMNLLKYMQGTFMIVNFIAISFTVYFSTAFIHLFNLGLYSEIHRASAYTFILLFLVSGFAFTWVFIKRLLLSDRIKKYNDEQMDMLLREE